MCKIAVNLMLAVVNENLMEVTLLAQKAGVSRHAFLAFLNDSVMGSTFTKYKAPALINLDFTTTFPATGQRKDLDLGLKLARELEVPMPITAATREMLQAHIGVNRLKPDADAAVGRDFAALFETMALLAGVTLESENVEVSDGLEPEEQKGPPIGSGLVSGQSYSAGQENLMKVAVAGLGWWGKQIIRCLDSSPRFEVLYGVDPQPPADVEEFRKSFKFKLENDLAKVLADPAVEGVVLATPHALHEEQALAVIAAGKNLFCEKPLTMTGAGAQAGRRSLPGSRQGARRRP